MRTGPFSDTSIIQTLNASFVPVFAVNEDYRDNGSAPPAERAALDAIHKEGYAKRLSVGTVHVYICNANGELTNTMHVAEAAQTRKLLALLNRVVAEQNAPKGKPVVPPRPQSRPPDAPAGSLTLHLTARPLTPQGSWDGISENWIVYTPQEQKRLLPSGAIFVGTKWTPNETLFRRLLLHFYPVTENNDLTKNRILEQQATAIIFVGTTSGVTRAQIEGKVVMKHSFYHQDDGKIVVAPFTGYLESDATTRRIRAFRLATHKATYNGGEFGIAVRSE